MICTSGRRVMRSFRRTENVTSNPVSAVEASAPPPIRLARIFFGEAVEALRGATP